MTIYALTGKDVAWIGNAAAVAGGFVTAWGEEDNGHILPEIIERHTRRQYLGTVPGVDAEAVVPQKIVDQIIADLEEDIARHHSTHHIVLAGIARAKEWIARIEEVA